MRRLAALALTLATPAAAGEPLLASVFQDGAVLQRDRPVAVFGRAAPGERVTVRLDGRAATARAGADGRWRATLPAHGAGGPFSLTAEASGGARQRIGDVLVGDVLLCSGQSNMELEVRNALDAGPQIAQSADPGLRLLHLEKVKSPVPVSTLGPSSRWTAAAPETVPDFSAACYYLGRELRRARKVPIGLIEAAWGGSTIQSWMSADALRRFGGYDGELALVGRHETDPAGAGIAWTGLWERWWDTASHGAQGRPWRDPPSAAAWRPVPAFTRWQQWGDRAIESYHGSLWYRTSVTLTAAQAAQAATLALGPIEEEDHSWVNGRAVGGSEPRGAPRSYALDAGVLRPGENSIVVHVFDGWIGGGIVGPADGRALILADGTRVPLDRPWSWLRPPAGAEWPPRPPWGSMSGFATIGNGMISPLAPYTLRGVAWYQGESNEGDGRRYEALLGAWMADWRRRFEQPDLPFMLVQLTAFGDPAIDRPVAAGWGTIRDAQRRAALADPHAALVATHDLGDRFDIHPANKQQVGLRLARAARSALYGEAAAVGPAPVDAVLEAGGVAIRFAGVDGRLSTYSSGTAIGFELCGPGGSDCRFADGRAKADRVVLTVAAGVRPAVVRFCWSGAPICNLFDGAGVPPPTFELPVRSGAAGKEANP